MQPFKGPIVSNIEKIEEYEGHEIVTSKSGKLYMVMHNLDIDFLIDTVIIRQMSGSYEIKFPLARDPEMDLSRYEPVPKNLLEWAIFCFEYEED